MTLEKYSDYLKNKRVIPDKHITHYLRWVKDFLHFCNLIPGQNIRDDKTEDYLINLSQFKKEWQVLQAKEAILLYQFFLKGGQAITANSDTGWMTDWKSASDMMIRMLRLKQRSYRTEQSYLSWLRSFYKYVRPLPPSDLGDSHIKYYLPIFNLAGHIEVGQ